MRLSRSIVVVAALAAVALGTVPAPASHLAESPKKHRIVYHLSEAGADKASFALRNIQNHIAGVKGWANIEALELVVHGPALRSFIAATMDPDVKRLLAAIQGQGVVLGACGNTIASFNLALDQLADGARHLPQGGVVRIMELEEQGYVYIRP